MCSGNCSGTCGCEDGLVLPTLPGTPGVDGTNGTNGMDGLDAYTTLSGGFVQPAIGSNVTIGVTNAGQQTGSWAFTGQIIYIENGGYYQVVTPGAASLVVKNLGYPGNTGPGSNVFSGGVSPGGIKGTDSSVNISGDLNGPPSPYDDITGGGFTYTIFTVVNGGTYSFITTVNTICDDSQDLTFIWYKNSGQIIQGNVVFIKDMNRGTEAVSTVQLTNTSLSIGDQIKIKVISTGTNAKAKLFNSMIFKTA